MSVCCIPQDNHDPNDDMSIILLKTETVVHYLSHHEAHKAKDSHRDMSGRPHEEVDDVGVK